MLEVGIDTGGTFCDFVAADDSGRVETTKVPSTPRNPAEAISTGLADLLSRFDGEMELHVTVGTTVATNALIERRGPRVTLLATDGFTDVPFIARMDKASLYDLNWSRPKPLVRRRDCIGVVERVDHHGAELTELDIPALKSALRAHGDLEDGVVAVCLLFSYLAPQHEQDVAKVIAEVAPGALVSLSHEVSPVWREYERTSTTIADAFVKPVVDDYVDSVGSAILTAAEQASWRVLASNGGYLAAEQARELPVQIVLSGLAGGVVGATHFAREADVPSLFTLDMGGTSCDIGLISDGTTDHRDEFDIAFGIPVTVPTVAVETIGAGGGSIASVDAGGLLHVGPRSAGADPGPIAYGRGGTEPTLTDANLVLGRLDAADFLGGRMTLDPAAALAAYEELGAQLGLSAHAAALAATRIADENMANAVRLIAADRGLDPRDFAVMAFGGAGPLHACAVARRVDIGTVLVPPGPGLCSAFGALVAPARIDRVRTVFVRDESGVPRLAQVDAELQSAALAELRTTGTTNQSHVDRSASMRYGGQNFNLEVPLPTLGWDNGGWAELLASFEREHEAKYGFALPGEPVEVIELRVTAYVDADDRVVVRTPDASGVRTERPVWFEADGPLDCPVIPRRELSPGDELVGPVIVQEDDSTTIVAPGDRVRVGQSGVLVISLEQQA